MRGDRRLGRRSFFNRSLEKYGNLSRVCCLVSQVIIAVHGKAGERGKVGMWESNSLYTIPQKVGTLKQGKTAARPEIVDTQGGVKTQTVDIFRTGINLV